MLRARLFLAFFLSLAATFAATFSGASVALLAGYDRSVQSQDSVVMAIDADPQASGVQACVGDVSVGSTVSIDFVIQDVPDIEGFGLRLLYDEAILSVASKDKNVSILGPSGLEVGDSVPDADGSFLDGYVGEGASGSGILMRYTVRAEAAGLTRLHLVVGDVDTNYVDSSLMTRLPDRTDDAFVSVGAPCPESFPPAPTPAPRGTGEAQPGRTPDSTPPSSPRGTPLTPQPTSPPGISQQTSPAPATTGTAHQETPRSVTPGEVRPSITPQAAAQSKSEGEEAGASGEGGGFPWLPVALVVAAVAAGGAGAIYWRRIVRKS